MILEANKLQFERSTVLGYDALKTYEGYSVVRTTLVQGYEKPTVTFEWLADSNECILSVVGTEYHTILGRGASAYDALLMARKDVYGFVTELDCTDIIKDLIIQLTR